MEISQRNCWSLIIFQNWNFHFLTYVNVSLPFRIWTPNILGKAFYSLLSYLPYVLLRMRPVHVNSHYFLFSTSEESSFFLFIFLFAVNNALDSVTAYHLLVLLHSLGPIFLPSLSFPLLPTNMVRALPVLK